MNLVRAGSIYIFRLFVSLAIVAGLLWMIDLNDFPRLSEIKLEYVSSALAIVFVDRLLNAYKWNVLVKAKGLGVQFRDILKIYFTSGFVGLVLPSSMGGEVLKGYGLAKATSKVVDSASSVVVDRITGLVTLTAFCVLGYYVADPSLQRISSITLVKNVALAILVGTMLISIVGFVIPVSDREVSDREVSGLSGKGISLVRRVWRSFYQYRTDGGTLVAAMLLSALVKVLRILLVWLCALSVGISLDFLHYLLFVPFVQLGSMIPVSLAGIGIEEGAAVYFFSLIGADPARILGMMILSRMLVIISVSPGGWVYFREGLSAKTPSKAPQGRVEKIV